jgi:hypothetical protein
MKLTINGFMDILAWISGFYTNFNFKPKNENGEPSTQFQVWYEVLSEYDEDILMSAVKSFCKESVYAPSSPAQILEYIRSKLISRSLSGDGAWEIGYGKVKACGFDIDYAVSSLKSENQKVIARTIEEMRSEFRNVLTEQLPFIKNRFLEAYKRNLDIDVKIQVMQGQLETKNIKLLGE